MKTFVLTACLTLCLLALAVGANAQSILTFSDLPLVATPTLMPNGYGRIDWNNFFYVDPYEWSGSGPGYKHGPTGKDVAFIGGKVCRLYGDACYGTLNDVRGFELVSATVAAGFSSTQVTVTAYNNGVFVGTQSYTVTTDMQALNFPAAWGIVTEVVIQASGESGDLVVYSLSVYTLGG